MIKTKSTEHKEWYVYLRLMIYIIKIKGHIYTENAK